MSKQEALNSIYHNTLECMGFIKNNVGMVNPLIYPDILQVKELILAEEQFAFKTIRKLHKGRLTMFNYKLIKDLLIGCWKYYIEHYHRDRWLVIDYYHPPSPIQTIKN